MKRDLFLWQFGGFVFTSLFGTLLHFLYDWTSQSVFIAPFSGVNESTWEHMKLLYFPLFIFALIQSRFFSEYESFWCIKFIGTVIGLVMIPVLFYTYNGAFGKSPDWLNITIFFICAAISYAVELLLFKLDVLQCNYSWVAFLLTFLIGVVFIVFTFLPPHLPLFKDPLTNTYGITS